MYEEKGRRPVDSQRKLLSDDDLDKFLVENKTLVWNNYFEDIGDGRTYQG
jgi:hypothetical protein